MLVKSAAVACLLAAFCSSAYAVEDKYNITATEQAACGGDAQKLCADSMDEDQLVSCMRTNRPSLSKICLITFNAGLRRRHMPL